MPALAFASCFRMLASGHFRFLQLVDIFFTLIGECFLHLHFCLSWLLVTLSIDIVIGSQLNSMKTSSCSPRLSKMKKMKQNEAQSTRAELTPLCVDSCRRCFFCPEHSCRINSLVRWFLSKMLFCPEHSCRINSLVCQFLSKMLFLAHKGVN